MSNYSSMLRDPRWQKKRLEIMKRANFQCESCEENKDELHIHHKYYEKGLKPWEYPEFAYICLCSECHKNIEVLTLEVMKIIAKNIISSEFFYFWDILKCDYLYSYIYRGEKETHFRLKRKLN